MLFRKVVEHDIVKKQVFILPLQLYLALRLGRESNYAKDTRKFLLTIDV